VVLAIRKTGLGSVVGYDGVAVVQEGLGMVEKQIL
jgi:hypothetical protein